MYRMTLLWRMHLRTFLLVLILIRDSTNWEINASTQGLANSIENNFDRLAKVPCGNQILLLSSFALSSNGFIHPNASLMSTIWLYSTSLTILSLQINSDVIMSAMASHITDVSIVCSTVCLGAYLKKSKLKITGLLRGIHRWPGISLHKGPVKRKMFPFDDVITNISFNILANIQRLKNCP